MVKTHKRVNSVVSFLYPKHGTRNILRSVKGVVLGKGVGPNGPYLTVMESCGATRTFSTRKIVSL
jgi:hypothetical protein